MSDLTQHRNCPRTKSIITPAGTILTGCSRCLHTVTHAADFAAKWRREASKNDHRADIIQRYDGDKINPEWVKLHEDKAREALGDQATEDILRK